MLVDMLENAPQKSISIVPLLKRLLVPSANPPGAEEIAAALSLAFTDDLSPVQCASLLTLLETTGRSREAALIAQCAKRMRDAAVRVDVEAMRAVIFKQARSEGTYKGGLCDIVGTGGDGHSTFNVSTTASIICAGLLLVAKHGSRASSSKSGSADMLQAIKPQGPVIETLTAEQLPRIFETGSYAFLFASTFHPGMKYVAPIRKDLGFRTLFNILGPLANPVYSLLEAGVVGVAKQELGPIFAEALRINGARKAMVVCGLEDLDEISCAGKTNCWQLLEPSAPSKALCKPNSERNGHGLEPDDSLPSIAPANIIMFQLEPADFGLPAHPLTEVRPGVGPEENAAFLVRLLGNELPEDDPTLHFVLMNAAALFVMSGICEADSSAMGEGDSGVVIKERGPGNGRWKEGVRRARWALQSGKALEALQNYIDFTNKP